MAALNPATMVGAGFWFIRSKILNTSCVGKGERSPVYQGDTRKCWFVVKVQSIRIHRLFAKSPDLKFTKQ